MIFALVTFCGHVCGFADNISLILIKTLGIVDGAIGSSFSKINDRRTSLPIRNQFYRN